MVMKNKLTEEFLHAIKEVEDILLLLQFNPHSFEKKGFAYYIEYKRGETVVMFLFGLSNWDVEMILAPNYINRLLSF